MNKEPMSLEERTALTKAKSQWRKEMRAYFLGWTKRGANKRDKDGRLMMNIPVE